MNTPLLTTAEIIDGLLMSQSARDALLYLCNRTNRTGECEVITRREEPLLFAEIERFGFEQLATQIHHPIEFIKGKIFIHPFKKPETQDKQEAAA